MSEKQTGKSETPSWPESSEYGDALGDILEDQVRRRELRRAAAPTSAHVRLHPALAPVLALVSIWLWLFPPSVLQPAAPIIPSAQQEAGLRMEMFIQFVNIQRHVAEHGRLPDDLGELGDGSAAVNYTLQAGNTFQLSGQSGDITVDFDSTQPVEDLLGDAVAIVSGRVTPPSDGAPTS